MSPPPPGPDGGCPACGAGLTPWMSVPSGEPADHAFYELVRCADCGSAVSTASPSADAYESGVYSSREPRLAGLIARVQRAVLGQPLGMLRGHIPVGGSVLDAGAGRGRLVARLRGEGFDARGIDASVRNVELAGVAVARSEIEHHEDRDLDAVVLWHVLEHLDDPGAALAGVRSWLRPDGTVLIGVPNLASLQRRLAGPRWFHFDAPRHRVHLTPAGLRALLERAGLEVVEEHHLVWQHNLHGMWFALLTRMGMTPGFPFHLAKRNVAPTLRDVALLGLAGPPLLLAALGLELVAAALRRGGTIAVVARASGAAETPS